MRRVDPMVISAAAALLGGASLFSASAFADQSARYTSSKLEAEAAFDIAPQPLDTALLEFSRQSNVQVMLAGDAELSGHTTPAVKGRLTARKALATLLENTGFEYTAIQDGTVTVKRTRPSGRAQVDTAGEPQAMEPPVRLAQAPMPSTPDSSPDSAEEKGSGVQEVVVTGSRIVRDGYEAPTPVTVLTQEALALSSPESLATALVQAPQLINSPTSNNGDHGTSAPDGKYFSLRGIGANRSLILLDGIRVPPTTYNGLVSADILPELLVKRIEVVTAGASAAYGSDAVGGVINYVIDGKFTGTKGVAQAGVSSRGDNKNYRLGFAGGYDFGKTHVLLSLERNQNDGYWKTDRPNANEGWFGIGQNATGVPGTAENPLELLPDVHLAVTTRGGLATSGPFAGTNFVTPTEYHAIVPGIPTNSPGYFIGGEFQDYAKLPVLQGAPFHNTIGFARVTHEVSENLQILAQLNVADNAQNYILYPNFVPSQTIFSGNAFLPAALQQQLTDSGTPSFTMSKTLDEIAGQRALQTTRNYSGLLGFKGNFGDTSWNLTYQHAQTKYKYRQRGVLELTKFAAAVDAVRDSNGNVVCRPTLSSDAAVRARYAGCVPFNLFGYGAATQDAVDYATGVSRQSTNLKTDGVQGSISRDVLSLPAGGVAVALGAEFRRQSLKLDSNADPAIAQDVTGLRGIGADTTRFFNENSNVANGAIKVTEGFGEVEVPLLKNARFADELSLNGAARVTDYSISGTVVTWKFGGAWAPLNGLRFRSTRSRDIRAPNAYEFFGSSTLRTDAFFDPHTGTSNPARISASGGNRDLTPEIANTFTIGAVVTPAFLDDLTFSLDYYDIKITDAITSSTVVDQLAACEASNGTSPLCDLITRPFPFSNRSPENFPTLIRLVPINVASLATKGIDLEATYRKTLSRGDLLIRAAGEYVTAFRQQAGPTQPQVSQLGVVMPKLVLTPSITYKLNELTFHIQQRIFGKNLTTQVASVVYADSHIPLVSYTDMTLAYQRQIGGSDMQFFLSAQNLFDKGAPVSPSGPLPGSLPAKAFYDTVGRQFTLGMRLNF